MAVPTVNITIEKGADYASTFTISNSDGTPFDLTNQSAVAKLKKFPSTTTSYSFTPNLIIATGKVTISMGNTVTNSIEPGRYYYDIILTNNITSKKARVIQGMAIVTPSIST
jgi:hypothetical protein